jgi:hypothetical protein
LLSLILAASPPATLSSPLQGSRLTFPLVCSPFSSACSTTAGSRV